MTNERPGFSDTWNGTYYNGSGASWWQYSYVNGNTAGYNVLPGDNNYDIVIRWTATEAGDLQLAGNYSLGKITGADQNSELYVSFNGAAYGTPVVQLDKADVTVHSYLVSLPAVQIGDTVDIRVHDEGHNWSGEVLLSAQISTVPEPTSLAVVGLSGLVLMRRRRA